MTLDEEAADIQKRIHEVVQFIINERSMESWDTAKFWFWSSAQALKQEQEERRSRSALADRER